MGVPVPGLRLRLPVFYVRRHDDYLSPWRPRDVIETPLDDVLDVNGWDLIKAIRLAARSNATVMEWLRSPLICRGQPAFAEELLDVCRAVVDHDAIRRHYLHVGRAHWNRSGAAEGGRVSLKKLLYAIRPAAALHWTRTLGSPVPPMNLLELLEEAPPAEDVIDAITALVRAKAVTRELGEGVVPEPIRRFVLHEFGLVANTDVPRLGPETRERASAAFTDLLRRFAPTHA
jgi:hypothetical protein